MLKFITLGCVLAALCGCSSSTPEAKMTPAAGAPQARGPVGTPSMELRTYGSLTALMDEGKLGSQVGLASLRSQPMLVGLGSLSDLRGEVLIFEQHIWLGYSNPDGTARGRELDELPTHDEGAAFLVTANVPAWQNIRLDEDVAFEQLESKLGQLVRSAGLDPMQANPLVIEGSLVNLHFNVVDGRKFRAGEKIDQQALIAAAVKPNYPIAPGVIVGFYSEAEQAFLHPNSKMHLHVLLRAQRQVGHLDRVDLPSGTMLRLPLPAR